MQKTPEEPGRLDSLKHNVYVVNVGKDCIHRGIEKNYGCAACVTMSMMGEKLMPSACEVDIAGTIGMYALALASQKPSALLDWNNNFAEDRDKVVCTHCSNYPKSFFENEIEIGSEIEKNDCAKIFDPDFDPVKDIPNLFTLKSTTWL